MGMRGPGARPQRPSTEEASLFKWAGTETARPKPPAWAAKGLSRSGRVIKFIEGLKITSGAHAGRKFRLRRWQREIIREWYATDRKGRRIVRTGLLTMGRKNGKTGLVAALALAHLVGPEQEPRGQVVAGASDRDQSGLIFDELVAYIESDPVFAAQCNIKRHEKTIEELSSGSRFRALSSDAKKAHGLSPSVVILDELAQWGSGVGRGLYDALVTATGARADPLTIVISTQSADDLSLMSEMVDYGRQVRAGIIDDATFSAFIYEAPADADPWDEAVWPLANPALGDFRSLEEMRAFAARAQRMPILEATFRNLYLNQRIDAEERWLPPAEWDECDDDVDLDALAGQRCYGGLDLGSVRDLTAFALFWPESGALAVWTWCPGDALRTREETDRVPYTVWSAAGLIEPTPGRATDKRAVALRLAELHARFRPDAIAFDSWQMTELERILGDEGITLPLRSFGQGYKSMAPAMKSFEERVLNRRLRHGGNPLLRWAVSNVAVERDAAGNGKPSKERSRERIDPIVASVMAVGIAAAEPPQRVYDFNRPLVLGA